jgi:aquaporin Z
MISEDQFTAYCLAGKLAGYDVAVAGLGQNGWGEGYLGGYGLGAAGLAIGATLIGLTITFINVTGASVNPARSLGPAIFVGGKALSQLWLFFVAPIVGGVLAGLLFRNWRFEAD